MTKTRLILALLAGGAVAVGGVVFNLDGAQAQDIATVRNAKAAAEAVLLEGVSLEDLEAACMEARDALVDAEEAHFEPGTPPDAVDAAVSAEAAACVQMLVKRKQAKADKRALKALTAAYWCKHKNRGCP